MKNRAEQKVNNKTFCEINPWPQMIKQVALDIFTKTCQRCHTGYTKNYAHDWCFVVLYSWWCHQMETFPALLALCAVNSPHKGQWRGALMFSLIWAWINGGVNNRDVGDLTRHRAHYDVTVMVRIQRLIYLGRSLVLGQSCVCHSISEKATQKIMGK